MLSKTALLFDLSFYFGAWKRRLGLSFDRQAAVKMK